MRVGDTVYIFEHYKQKSGWGAVEVSKVGRKWISLGKYQGIRIDRDTGQVDGRYCTALPNLRAVEDAQWVGANRAKIVQEVQLCDVAKLRLVALIFGIR